MALQLGDTAPDFKQDSTDGPISFHDWAGDSWVVLFSHPKDFTPVCTTELGEVARLKPEFDKRNAKVIGLSVDPLEDHNAWCGDIEETQGSELGYQVVRPLWRELQDGLMERLDSLTVDELCTRANQSGIVSEGRRNLDFTI